MDKQRHEKFYDLNRKYPFQFYTLSRISLLEQNGFNFDDYSFNLQHEHELYVGNINGLICRHDMGYPLRMLKYLKQDPDTMVKRKLTFLLPENYRENIGNLKGLRENVLTVFDLPVFKDRINIITYKVDNSDIMEKIEELKSMPKFDVIIANPPYGEHGTGDLQLHYTIISKLINHYNKKMIVIMPHRIAYTTSNQCDKFKTQFDMVSEVIEVKSKCFVGTNMANVGIFTFEPVKQKSIHIKLLNKDYTVSSWFETTPFSEYENSFMQKLYNKNFSLFTDVREGNTKESLSNKLKNYGFSVSLANGALNGKFFSSITNIEPVKDKQTLIDWILNYKVNKKAAITHDNKQFLENLKLAMNRPLLRFGLHKMQDNQNMNSRVYRYVPDIDWSDNKTLTDEGILELCSFSHNKAVEFALYCKDYIEKLDNQK